MAADSTHHADRDSLLALLWAGAKIEGSSRALAHLVSTCPLCYCPENHRKKTKPAATPHHFQEENLSALVCKLLLLEDRKSLKLLQHLLDSCDKCSLVAGSLTQREESRCQDISSVDYQAMGSRLARRVTTWRGGLAKENSDAESLLEKLLSMPPERRQLLIRNSVNFGSWSLVTKLGEKSRRAVAQDHQQAVDLASLAVEVAQSLSSWKYDPRVTEDIKSQALANLANAYRVSNDHEKAEAYFAEAEACLIQGTGLESVRCEILELKATLRTDQRRFQEARALLRESSGFYREVQDPNLEGRALIREAFVCREMGEAELAIELLERALPLIDPDQDGRFSFVAEHNLVVLLVDLERFEEASLRLSGVRRQAATLDNALDNLRVQWTAGRIEAGLGETASAESSLNQVKAGFLAASLPYDAALVSLELALLYAHQGRLRELKFLALEILPVFARHEIHREALAALTLFGKAAAAEEATVEVIRRTLGDIEKARKAPALEAFRRSTRR